MEQVRKSRLVKRFVPRIDTNLWIFLNFKKFTQTETVVIIHSSAIIVFYSFS